MLLLLAPTVVAASPDGVTIHVVRHGWHTGIAVPLQHIAPHALPEVAHFRDARYLEVGWGDRDFYMAPGFNAWYALKGLLWPTPGVLHLVGLQGAAAEQFPESEVAELRVDRQGLDAMIAYFSESFERVAVQAAPLAPALYGSGAFYPSRERFHLFQTCNVWIARALRAAGLPIDSTPLAGGIMAQARRLEQSRATPCERVSPDLTRPSTVAPCGRPPPPRQAPSPSWPASAASPAAAFPG